MALGRARVRPASLLASADDLHLRASSRAPTHRIIAPAPARALPSNRHARIAALACKRADRALRAVERRRRLARAPALGNVLLYRRRGGAISRLRDDERPRQLSFATARGFSPGKSTRRTASRELAHFRLTPVEASVRGVRRQPAAGSIATIEAIVLARILEPYLRVSTRPAPLFLSDGRAPSRVRSAREPP